MLKRHIPDPRPQYFNSYAYCGRYMNFRMRAYNDSQEGEVCGTCLRIQKQLRDKHAKT